MPTLRLLNQQEPNQADRAFAKPAAVRYQFSQSRVGLLISNGIVNQAILLPDGNTNRLQRQTGDNWLVSKSNVWVLLDKDK